VTQLAQPDALTDNAETPNLFGPGFVHATDDAERKVDFKIVASLFGGMFLIAAVISHYMMNMPVQGDVLAILASLLLGTPIIIDATKGLFGEGGLGARSSHMEELIALAIIASFASGAYIECGSVAFFMLISSFIEDRTAVGARKTIESLIRITPTRAFKLTEHGEVPVEAKDLRPGDIVVVRPGDNIPGDGIIKAGSSTIDQANITGESVPVEKTAGDDVFSGTINESGRLEVEITRAGKDSTLGQVQKLILQAAETKPAVVRVLERYAAYYTPTVLMIAFIVYILSGYDLNKCISLLLIACPCAIILSGPTAMVAALSASARLGVMIKSVTDLEVARHITAIVLDKTGTLTVGKLSVTRMKPAQGVDGADLLQLCASLEESSKHPVARAVNNVARKANVELLPVEDFQEIAGRGVSGMVNGQTVLVGREKWLKEQGVDMSALQVDEDEGLSLLFVAQNNKAIGWIGLADTSRRGSAAAMEELAELGVQRRVMITGDLWSPARHIASEMNITDFEAEALPGHKLDMVGLLKEKGHTVAVVGDGVNDGPALAAGDISIAMGAAGSDVAIHSASIALMNNNLNRIAFLIRLSRRTMFVIRQNLIGVIFYILIMLVLLSMGHITPLVAAICHGVSSIAVVFNSARLIREGEDVVDTEIETEARPGTRAAETRLESVAVSAT